MNETEKIYSNADVIQILEDLKNDMKSDEAVKELQKILEPVIESSVKQLIAIGQSKKLEQIEELKKELKLCIIDSSDDVLSFENAMISIDKVFKLGKFEEVK